MNWPGKRKGYDGWLALGLHHDRVDLVHVRRPGTGRPVVALCESHLKASSEPQALRRMCAMHKLGRYRCTTLLDRKAYQLHQLEAPSVPASEMRSAIRWRAKDVIDYPLDEATIDLLEIPADSDAPAPDHKVYAVTAPNSAIRLCMQAFNDARVPLKAIDIAELAQRNLAALFEPSGHGVAMLAFYEHEGMLTFTRAGELYNARRIDLTVSQLMDGDRQEAHLERIALEVQRSLDHLGRQYHYVPLSKLLLGPLPGQLGRDLHEYLSANINLPVETVDLAQALDLAAVPELRTAACQSRFLQTIGAALRDEPTTVA